MKVINCKCGCVIKLEVDKLPPHVYCFKCGEKIKIEKEG